jgi:O-antigen/teichoic acid export membrane protein
MESIARKLERPVSHSSPEIPSGLRELDSNRLLVGNSIWNLVGDTLPLLAAVIAVPLTIRGLGTDRFGVLITAWMLTGYLSLLDFGLGRALTKHVAQAMGNSQMDAVPKLFWTALQLCLLLGGASAIIFALACPWVVYHGLKVSIPLRPQTETVFYLIAICLPVLVCSSCLRGFLAALQRFDLLNKIKIPLSVFSFIVPVLVLHFTLNLAVIMSVLLVGRFLAALLELFMCLNVAPGMRGFVLPDWRYIRPLFSFGAWVTVSTVLNPLLVYSDRFLIGALLSMTDVTHYSAPMEMLARLVILPSAIAQVTFPALSYSLVKDPERAAILFERANKYILGVMFPVILLAVTFAPELMRLWLGGSFAGASAEVTQFLSIAALLTGLTYVPASLMQAAGRPDIFATVVLIEAPFYLPLMWVMIRLFGIDGAALAYVIRSAVNAAICLVFAYRMLRSSEKALQRTALAIVAAVCMLTFIVALRGNPYLRATFAFGMLSAFGWSAWTLFLNVEERDFITARLSAAREAIFP